MDSPIDIIQATVQLEQPDNRGGRTVGTGFLVSSPTADGSPGTLLVTANHVLAGMPGREARIGFRTVGPDGSWRYAPAALRIRDEDGAPLWTRHPAQDVAAMRIKAPPQIARAAIPAGYLAADDGFAERNLAPGDELMVLGFPRGVSANKAGFPVLRSGRVASYPLSPRSAPTFLLDFSVFPGNSGGPVFLTRGPRRTGSVQRRPFVAGLLTQQVKLDDERLEIGIVTHAKHIAETIDLIEGVRRPRMEVAEAPAAEVPQVAGATPAADSPQPASAWSRLAATARRCASDLADATAAALERLTRRIVAWLDPTHHAAQPPTRTA